VASLLPLHNFYSILICLLEPSSSEAGETWVRNNTFHTINIISPRHCFVAHCLSSYVSYVFCLCSTCATVCWHITKLHGSGRVQIQWMHQTKYRFCSNFRKKIFLILHLKNGGCHIINHTQSSKNRANVFVISNTVYICLGWVVQLFRCVIFFVLSCTTQPHVWWHPWIVECFFPVVVLWNVSRLGSK
jgi:hypothetical protein